MNQTSIKTSSWFKAMRSTDAVELIRSAPNAFIIAYVIAYRARWSSGFSADNLQPGEAMLGDYISCGLTEQQYRTAKAQLQKWNFATFKTTNKGTIAKLTDTRLFSILAFEPNGQSNTPATGNQRTGNGQLTTNYKGKRKEGFRTVDNTPRNFIPE